VATCDHCGEANVEGARFCSSCGAALPGHLREGLEVRKTVTILFCDVVGSTALGEATDPETTRKVMSRYAEAMAEVIALHGGTVERFRGDEVMAVFGIPVAHEDDALRAVRAATEMQRRLARLNAELRDTWAVELACRIGINTGEVVAGDPGTGETFVTGDAVNLAKRLEQAAEPGAILIGTATYPLVKDAVKVGPRERFTAKGKSEPVTRLRLEGVDATAAGFARRLDAPLVGRADELEDIETALEQCFAERRCGVLSIVGPAGIGKSRLAHEILKRFITRSRVASGRCLPYGAGITYWPLVELVRDLGGLEAIEGELSFLDDAQLALDRVHSAIGAVDVVAPSDELFWGVKRMFEGIARDHPLLLLIEDLQWAEPTMLDLIEYVAAFASGPIAILCNARPELLEGRPGWGKYPLFELAQLSSGETEELIGALGIDDVELRERIGATAEGNPLFAEQLAVMVAEAGSASAESLALPASIQALLAARLDSLEPAERRAIERASVIGKEFWPRAVADLSSSPDRPDVAGRLLSLTRKGLVHPQRADLPGEDTFRFRHSLIRDVAYGGMPKALRAELHAAFASWLRTQVAPGFGEHEEIVGYHAEQAHRYRTELGPQDDRTRALAEQAAELLGAAGHRALARDDMSAAAGLLDRTAALLPVGDPRRLHALRDSALAYWEAGRAEQGVDLLRRLYAEAGAAGDEPMLALADLERIVHEQLTGADVELVKAAAERVIELRSATGDHVDVARAWRRLAAAHRRVGAYSAAEDAARNALRQARAAANRQEEARAADALSNCLLYGPTPASRARAACAELLAAEGRTRTLEANVTGVVAALDAMLGDFDAARESYIRAAAVLEELGHELARAALTQIGAPLELLAGDPVAAEREARRGAAIYERYGSSIVQTPLIAEALHAQGRYDDAARTLAEAPIESGPGFAQWQVRWRIVAARLAVADGNGREALASAKAGVDLAAATDDLSLRGDATAVLAASLAATGRPEDATEARDAALELYEAKGNVAAAAALASHASFAT
jgi:class 3 adenylate cyclase/tetratricopeptide (TPR) repeat protein